MRNHFFFLQRFARDYLIKIFFLGRYDDLDIIYFISDIILLNY